MGNGERDGTTEWLFHPSASFIPLVRVTSSSMRAEFTAMHASKVIVYNVKVRSDAKNE